MPQWLFHYYLAVFRPFAAVHPYNVNAPVGPYRTDGHCALSCRHFLFPYRLADRVHNYSSFHSGLQNITFKPVKGKLRLTQRLPLAGLKLTFYSDTFQPLKSNKILSLLFFFLFCREKFIYLLTTQQPFCAGGMWLLLVKDVYGCYLLRSNFVNLDLRRYGNANVHVGCIIHLPQHLLR